ncbi:unnamed protein product [Larinioides sclopetarius]|uniref:DUF19 domain-containing protein n=1 Tax=Larinioides sclopetarius TaxID=280406 RepID=A0AAV2AQH1_9ARAC
MWILAVTATFILAATSPKLTVAVPCSAEVFQECQMKYLRYLHVINETESATGLDTFCDNLKNDSDCPLQVSEDCKKKFASAYIPFMASAAEMSRWCNRSSSHRQIWFKMGFCTMKHQRQFQKCFKYPLWPKDENLPDCEYYKFQICLHDTILEVCGKGREKLANFITKHMQPHKDYCTGCVSTISNHWIVSLLSFFSLILKLKFLY